MIRTWAHRRLEAKERAEVEAWRAVGRPAPPPYAIKRAEILAWARRFGTRVFVETGTFRGDTAAAMAPHFERVHTVELRPELFKRAQRRFRNADNVKLWFGDSGEQLGEIVSTLDQPALFWLDGHYSGKGTARGDEWTPITRELDHVLLHEVRDHVLLIDDARDFVGSNGYPTLDGLRELVRHRRPDMSLRVENDIVRVWPGGEHAAAELAAIT